MVLMYLQNCVLFLLQEDSIQIESTIRERILTKIKTAMGAKSEYTPTVLKRAVTQLFNEIQTLDGISDNLVSKDELKVLLQKMNIFFSKSRFEAAFKLIDIDMSGTITLTEFINFIFPDEAREVSYYNIIFSSLLA
jgi:Ca2+-binding EF-hand superfamily protein